MSLDFYGFAIKSGIVETIIDVNTFMFLWNSCSYRIWHFIGGVMHLLQRLNWALYSSGNSITKGKSMKKMLK